MLIVSEHLFYVGTIATLIEWNWLYTSLMPVITLLKKANPKRARILLLMTHFRRDRSAGNVSHHGTLPVHCLGVYLLTALSHLTHQTRVSKNLMLAVQYTHVEWYVAIPTGLHGPYKLTSHIAYSEVLIDLMASSEQLCIWLIKLHKHREDTLVSQIFSSILCLYLQAFFLAKWSFYLQFYPQKGRE